MEKLLGDIINNQVKTNMPKINPTIIFNEGWMVRFLVYFSIQKKISIKGLDFNNYKNWSSEALISSPFLNKNKYREGYTHADIVLGDFHIDYKNNGKINIVEKANENDPKYFGIIEAKMKSKLSKGTKYFDEYNQATRNIVCIADNVKGKNYNTFFGVVAPENIFKSKRIDEHMELSRIIRETEDRFDVYQNPNIKSDIIDIIKKMEIITISYEEWIDCFNESSIHNKLNEFYNKCKVWNKIK